MCRLLAVLILTAVTACAPPVAPAPAEGTDPAPVSAPVQGDAAEVAACDARGGDMRPVCRMQSLQCVIDYSDAGRACRDGDDCQGDCRADVGATAGAPVTGQCQASSDPCGCFTTVEDGRAEAGLCVD